MIDLLERFAAAHPTADARVISAIRDYLTWQMERRKTAFVPAADNDVDLRTYLLDLRVNGAPRAVIKKQVSALKRFYKWMKRAGIITSSPFEIYNFDGAFLARKHLYLRRETLPSDPLPREVARLTALNQIAEQLNTSVDVQSALTATLNIVLQVMGLQTGWVSMLNESPIRSVASGNSQPDAFTLVAACGLPPGLADNDCRILRQPPACHCQRLLLEGKLTRAVNVVECARLKDSALGGGDNQGLLFHASIPLITRGKPLGLINVATAQWQFLTHADLHFLSAVNGQVVTALERAFLYDMSEAQRAAFQQELLVAHDVQASLLPQSFPVVRGFGFAGAWRPAREVAGDFYDIFPMAQGRWGIVIGDVAGKGTGAVLYMAMARSLILSSAQRHTGPATVLMEANRTILMQYSLVTFVTVFFAVLDPRARTLTYANAGHNPPIMRQSSGTLRYLNPTGAAIGMLNELALSETTIRLEKGDALVMYTDGVTEALNTEKEFYEDTRLAEAVAAAPRKAQALLAHIEADLTAFIQDAPQSDDIAFFVLNMD